MQRSCDSAAAFSSSKANRRDDTGAAIHRHLAVEALHEWLSERVIAGRSVGGVSVRPSIQLVLARDDRRPPGHHDAEGAFALYVPHYALHSSSNYAIRIPRRDPRAVGTASTSLPRGA